MRKLLLLFLWGATLLLGAAPLTAQNSVDVLGGGPQPPNPILAIWQANSNAPTFMDITSPIVQNFVYGGFADTVSDIPAAASGRICLVQRGTALPAGGLFATKVLNCEARSAIAVVIFNNNPGPIGSVNAPGAVPVFTISQADGLFLRDTVGSNAVTQLSNFQIQINVAPLPANPTGQHNCPSSQAVTAYDGPGTANFTPNESLCLPVAPASEPSIRVDSQGTIYVESIRGVPGGLDLWRWNQAADGGPNADGSLPFKYEGQPDGCGITPFVSNTCSGVGVAPGGGDGDLAVNTPDPMNGNIPNLAVVSLTAAEVTASHSTTRADTYSVLNPAVAQIPVDDRMWIEAFDDPNHVYIEYHDFTTTSQIIVQRSNDGGETYTDILASPVVATALEPTVGPPTGNVAGVPRVDRSSCPSRGNLYQIFLGPDNPTDNLQNSAKFINAVYVGVATNVSLASPTLTFNDYKIFSCGAGSTCPSGAGLPNLFPALAVDNFGFVYAVWSDQTDIYYSFSNNFGTRWSPAIKVTQNTSQAGKSNVFPWVAADANGHVAIAWYGADQAGNSNKVPANTHWNVFVAETVNGHAITPVFTLSQATDHVNHTGTISTEGFVLNGPDRSLGDFFQIAIDPTNHLINVAYADNHVGAQATYFTRQKTATSGIATEGKCAGTSHQARGKGDQAGKHGGTANFAFNFDDSNPQSNNASFSDPGSGINFQAAQVTSATFDEVAQSVTLTGLGTDNGVAVAFTIVAVDSSLVPPGLFSITLSDGYSNGGNLLDGSITVY